MFRKTFFCRAIKNDFPESDAEVLIPEHFTARKALSTGNLDARNTVIPV